MRQYYDLESLYGSSEVVELPFLADAPERANIQWQTSQKL